METKRTKKRKTQIRNVINYYIKAPEIKGFLMGLEIAENFKATKLACLKFFLLLKTNI